MASLLKFQLRLQNVIPKLIFMELLLWHAPSITSTQRGEEDKDSRAFSK